MRFVSIAICTSGEPVSCSFRPCFVMSSCLTSLVRAMRPPRVDVSGNPARREGRTRPAELRSGLGYPTVRVGVAAGHPATAEAGLEILAEGGTAADAAVAASLASCVAETVMTGLLGGGHALWWDGDRKSVV